MSKKTDRPTNVEHRHKIERHRRLCTAERAASKQKRACEATC